MARSKAAWGIEVGSNAIKAIRLEREGKDVAVTDFAVIPHKKVLTTPDLDRHEMIRLSLGQFISQKDLEGEHLVMSVPGHSAFARFAKLPPVDPKKVPDIVKFEAVQQIPFPIEEVEWDYQTFSMDDSPEITVGIFAITRERVNQTLGLYDELGIGPEALTLSPVSVYNAMAYDFDLKSHKGPVIFLDIGTQATDVIVAEEGRCWIRTFPLGGTHFTEAIASAFKISYSKAEKLKHEAASSKYAKQIMQAMRPVFSDLLQDLQRSIGYYQSMHREAELNTMVGLGSTFKIPGLRKFLGQQLQISVARLDEYKRISVGGREAASFAEHAVNMATAYGCALQGVGLAEIDANLVPVTSLREQIWQSKTKWFAAAAAIAIVAGGVNFTRYFVDQAALNPGGAPDIVQTTIEQGNRYRQQYQELSARDAVGSTTENMMRLLKHREIWPHLLHDARLALASTDPQPELLSGDLEQIRSIQPRQRRLVELRELDGQYKYNDDNDRRIAVTMRVRLSHSDPVGFLNETVADWLRDNADRDGMPYEIDRDTISLNPTQRRTIRITDDGEEEGVDGPRGDGRRGGGDRPQGGFDDPPTPPSGGGRGGALGGPGGDAGGGALGGPGASPPRGGGGPAPPRPAPRGAPGGGGAGGALGGPGGTSPPSPGGAGPTPPGPTPPGPTPPRGGDPPSPDEGREHRELDSIAPIPSMPRLFPAGSTYDEMVITFEVILRDPTATPDPAEQAGDAPDRDEEGAA